MKLDQHICLDEIMHKFENGSCWVRVRSFGQILGKPCVHSRGCIFSPIIIKVCQSVCLDDILDEFENGLCQVKN